MRIVSRAEIDSVLPSIDLLPAVEAAFVSYSRGEAVVPPVGELLMDQPPGEVHIKYGYVVGGEHYVIKIASGFYENPKRGLPSSNGMMLVFRLETGEPVAALLDEGRLTQVRTAVAGAIAAKHFARRRVERIGILGTGEQARLQLEHLAPVVECRRVLVWGRNGARAASYASEMSARGFEASVAAAPNDLLRSCDLIVSATASTVPLLTDAEAVRPGCHITAVGSDTTDKQELSAELVERADLVVADSIPQCRERGEIHQARKWGAVREDAVVELGQVIGGDAEGRTSDRQVTIADLTGVAVQDIAIANAVLAGCG